VRAVSTLGLPVFKSAKTETVSILFTFSTPPSFITLAQHAFEAMAAATTSIGSASITPAETWDAVQASMVAGIVGPIACVVYIRTRPSLIGSPHFFLLVMHAHSARFHCVFFRVAVFLAWLGVSYVRFIYFIQPTLKWAKNTELEKMSKLLSDYQRITGLFSQYAGLFSMNVLSAAMVRIPPLSFAFTPSQTPSLFFILAHLACTPFSFPDRQVFAGTFQTIGGAVDSQGAC
jgi:hypothetical protein